MPCASRRTPWLRPSRTISRGPSATRGPGLLILIAAPLLVRDRRLWFALAAGCSFAFPLLFLPGRQFPVYVYAPLAFLVIAVAAGASVSKVTRIAVPIVLAAVWMPWTYLQLREYRKSALTIAGDNRAYVTALADFLRTAPDTRAFILDSRPEGMHPWGVTGAIAILSPVKDRRVVTIDSPEALELLREHDLAILSWHGFHRRLKVIGRSSAEPFRPYVTVLDDTPIWQLGEGWYESEGGFRWMAPVANAIVMRPAAASQFELKVNVGLPQLGALSVGEARGVLGGGAHRVRRPDYARLARAALDGPAASAGRDTHRVSSRPSAAAGQRPASPGRRGNGLRLGSVRRSAHR